MRSTVFLLSLLLALLVCIGSKTPAEDLATGFVAPPCSALPWAYWFRQNGQISREGITRDFEQMRAKGIGGVILWDQLVVGKNMAEVPLGIRWLDSDWWDLYRHTLAEAGRLNIALSHQLCWCINCGGPWITPEHTIQRVVFSETLAEGPSEFHAILPQPTTHWDFYRDIAVLALPMPTDGEAHAEHGAEPVVSWAFKTASRELRDRLPAALEEPDPERPDENPFLIASTLDLTAKMEDSGLLTWRVPEGRWIILRIGHTAHQYSNTSGYVAPDHGGFEVNVLNQEAMEIHLHEFARKLVDCAGPGAGEVLQYLHTDSWEMPTSNWTQTFREEFRRRRGYDLLPYLPVLAGKLVESRDVTNRFLWDFRRTIGDLIAEDHYGALQEFATRHGMGIDCEAGGPAVHFDALQCLGRCETPMGEIWGHTPCLTPSDHQRLNNTTKQAASAAHIYGRKIAAAETFTTIGPHWEEDPAMLKPIADLAFANGVNRIVAHTISHSPPEWGEPGLEYFAGSHMNPNVTWWDQSGPWFQYLARCSHLLQQGRFVADVCYFYGEGVPNYMPPRASLVPALPVGYDYDGVNAEVLLTRAGVENGRIVLPDGMSYRLLVLPPLERMTPVILQQVKDFVEAGATVVGPRPVKSPSLTDYPKCDESVQILAAEVWGDCDGQQVKERAFGKGRIIWGMPLQDVLLADGVKPDFEASDGVRLSYIHRSLGTTDIYFVANREGRNVTSDCTFRVSGKQPEIWNPVTGDMCNATAFSQTDGRTILPLQFAPYGSLFIVFRKPIPDDAAGEARSNFVLLSLYRELAGPWTVRFDPNRGGPDSVDFAALEDWSKRPEDGIKHYSGTATYLKVFDLPKIQKGTRMFLSLGRLKNIAEVTLNGKNLGVVWTAPWQVEITGALKTGDNHLEIKVTNLWPNRLIGDQLLPAETRSTKTNVTKFTKDSALLKSGLFGPVTLQISEEHLSQ